ncbi:MAG: hypothetical protein ACFFDY_13715 [Candidatus Thorarchaeota archaeon]
MIKKNLKKRVDKKITEINKITKISLIAYGIVTLLYGIMYVFLTDLFFNDIVIDIG